MRSLLPLNKYFKKYRWRLLAGVFFVAVSNLFAIYPAQLVRGAFDVVAEGIHTSVLLSGFEAQQAHLAQLSHALLLCAGMILGLALLKGLFMFFMRQTIIVMSRLIEYDLKNEIFDQYQHLNLAFYKRNKTGDLMNRISEDVSRVRMYLGPAIMYTINLFVLFALVIITMLRVNAELTAYVLFPLPVLSITIYYVSSIINKKSERVQRQLSLLSSFVQEKFSGIRVLKAYNRKHLTEEQFEKECEAYKEISLSLVKTNALFFPMMILLIGLSTILTIFVGGRLAIAGEISPGNIAEFIIYVNMLTWPVAAVGWVTSLVQRAAASQTRINEFLQQTPEIVNPTTEPSSIEGQLEFRNVSFTYPDSGIQAVNNLSFTVPKGESLAVIGRTGAGKSTLANLICRMYDVSEGAILLDGKDVREHNLDNVRTAIGYVPQEVFLFSDSVANNIGFGDKSLADNRTAIEQAAKDAAVYANIVEFDEGFDTVVGERGVTLSGGQKQRVSIARAIVKKPHLLIFDDCLSAVDTETEEEILQNLKRIMQDRTTIIISHRVSSVKDADNILVLDNGSKLEYGSHDLLMQQKGVYHDLYHKQLLEEEKIISDH